MVELSEDRRTSGVRFLSAATLLLVLPGSKFLVLGLVDLAFGAAVRLGGFFQVTALIIVLMRAGVRRLFRRTGEGVRTGPGKASGPAASPGP